MLLKIYKFISQVQAEIGNDSEVRLYAREGALEIRVDWWDKDFHARRQFTEIELAKVAEDNLPVSFFVAWCKNEYARKIKAG